MTKQRPEQDTAVVYKVSPAPQATIWRPSHPEAVHDLEHRKLFDNWEPLVLEGSPESAPLFTWIDGVECSFVVKIDLESNPATSSFGYQAGWVLDLAGDAAGYSLIIPRVGREIDVDGTEGIDLEHPTRWSFSASRVGESLFRSIPRLNDIFCGEYEYADDDPNTDLEDYYNMAFRIWVQLTGSTGLAFTEIWRGPL